MQIDISISLKDKFRPHSSLARVIQPRVAVHLINTPRHMPHKDRAEVIREMQICIPQSQLFMIIYIVMKAIKARALQHNSLLHVSHLTKSALFIQQNAAWNAAILMSAASKADICTQFEVQTPNYSKKKATLARQQAKSIS